MPKIIYPCERVPGEHRGRWIIQTYHATGTAYADDLCPHYATRAAAREAARAAAEAARAAAEAARAALFAYGAVARDFTK